MGLFNNLYKPAPTAAYQFDVTRTNTDFDDKLDCKGDRTAQCTQPSISVIEQARLNFVSTGVEIDQSSECWTKAFTCFPYGRCQFATSTPCTELGNECTQGKCQPIHLLDTDSSGNDLKVLPVDPNAKYGVYPDAATQKKCLNLFDNSDFTGVRKACEMGAYSAATLKISSGKWKCSNDESKRCGHDCGVKGDTETEDAFLKRCEEQADRSCGQGTCVRSCDTDTDCATKTEGQAQVHFKCASTAIAVLGIEVKSVEIAKMCKDSCEDNIVDQDELDDPSKTAARCSANTNTAPAAAWSYAGAVLAAGVALLAV